MIHINANTMCFSSEMHGHLLIIIQPHFFPNVEAYTHSPNYVGKSSFLYMIIKKITSLLTIQTAHTDVLIIV